MYAQDCRKCASAYIDNRMYRLVNAFNIARGTVHNLTTEGERRGEERERMETRPGALEWSPLFRIDGASVRIVCVCVCVCVHARAFFITFPDQYQSLCRSKFKLTGSIRR